MAHCWTTRCCSAIALVAIASTIASAAQARPELLTLLPVRPIWNLALESVVPAPPAFKDGRGFFPIGNDRLAAYDVENGTLLWLAAARPRFQPALGDDLIFLVEPDSLLALHDDTGAIAWRLPMGDALTAPLVWDNEWLVGTTKSGEVLAFRARDGALIWRHQIDGRLRGSAALAADRVYVPLDDGRIVALDVRNGTRIWERRLGGAPNEILALDERVFVGSNDNYFYAIATRNGEVLWRWSTGADVIGQPVVDDRRVYFVSYDNVLRGLDQRSGAQRWKRALPLRPTRGPVMIGDVLVVSGITGSSPAYRAKDGTPAGEIEVSGELIAKPHVVPGTALPQVVLVTRELGDNTMVRALARSVDPGTRDLAPLGTPISPPPLPYPDLTFETCTLPSAGAAESDTVESSDAPETAVAGKTTACLPSPELLGDPVTVETISLPMPAGPQTP